MLCRTSSVMPTPSSATISVIPSSETSAVIVIVSLPSDGIAWRTAFSTSGWMRNGGTMMSATSKSATTSIPTRFSPKRATSKAKYRVVCSISRLNGMRSAESSSVRR